MACRSLPAGGNGTDCLAALMPGPMTLPVATCHSANRDVVPCRLWSWVHDRAEGRIDRGQDPPWAKERRVSIDTGTSVDRVLLINAV